jgi:rubrerythrin
MKTRNLESDNLQKNEDWLGNNAAFTCPVCQKVFIVSGLINKNGRTCPECGKSKGFCTGGKKAGGLAYIQWEE